MRLLCHALQLCQGCTEVCDKVLAASAAHRRWQIGHTWVAGDVDDALEVAQQVDGAVVQPRPRRVHQQRLQPAGRQVQPLQPAGSAAQPEGRVGGVHNWSMAPCQQGGLRAFTQHAALESTLLAATVAQQRPPPKVRGHPPTLPHPPLHGPPLLPGLREVLGADARHKHVARAVEIAVALGRRHARLAHLCGHHLRRRRIGLMGRRLVQSSFTAEWLLRDKGWRARGSTTLPTALLGAKLLQWRQA